MAVATCAGCRAAPASASAGDVARQAPRRARTHATGPKASERVELTSGRRDALATAVLAAGAALVAAPQSADAAATASTQTLATKTKYDPTGVSASAPLTPAGGGDPVGVLRFVEMKSEYGRLRVDLQIELDEGALPAGEHGVQMHENGDPESESYNPERVPHGAPGATKTFGSQGASMARVGGTTGILFWCHVGDLGNVPVEADGSASALLPAPLLDFSKANQSPVGRAVTIHANADSFEAPNMGGIGEVRRGDAGGPGQLIARPNSLTFCMRCSRARVLWHRAFQPLRTSQCTHEALTGLAGSSLSARGDTGGALRGGQARSQAQAQVDAARVALEAAAPIPLAAGSVAAKTVAAR